MSNKSLTTSAAQNMSKHTKSNNHGFTLIELSVALSLAAMLMAAIVGVLIQTQRQTVLTHALTKTHWQESVKKLMRRDFLLAKTVRVSSGDLWLEGDFPEAASSGARSQLVGYGIRPWIFDGQSVLVRLLPDRITPLVVGPSKLVAERLDNRGISQPISDQFVATSSQYVVWIWEDEQPEASVTLHIASH